MTQRRRASPPRRTGSSGGLVTLGRLFYFGTVVDAELTRFWSVEPRITVAVIHVRTETLEGGFDARLCYFELAIPAEGGLLLNFDVRRSLI